MVKELTSLLEDGDIHEMAVLTDPTNEDSTCIKRKSAFRIIRESDRGSTRKARDCPGLNKEQHHNGTQPVPFYPNLPRWGSVYVSSI